MKIKNVIFDVGNVIVKWSPVQIIKNTFPEYEEVQQQDLIEKVFKSTTWTQLNLGALSENEAKEHFISNIANLDVQRANSLFYNIKASQHLIPGTTDLIKKLHENGYKLFALTDNIKEIIQFLQNKYDFWNYFIHTTVSAEIGLMKPGKEIFEYALKKNNLLAHETLFIDDHLPNTQTASLLGLHTILFSDALACLQELNHLGVAL